MCVGRYAEMMELSEAKRNHFEMPATEMLILCIPVECDTTSRFENTYSNNVVAFRWNAYLLCDICRHFASVMLHFASLITHNLRCIPAYTHQIPTGYFQSLLNNHNVGTCLWHVTKALLIASKHAEGMSLRNDEITNLTHPHYLLA